MVSWEYLMMKYVFFFVSVLNYLSSTIRSIPCINGEASAFLFHNLLYDILVRPYFTQPVPV